MGGHGTASEIDLANGDASEGTGLDRREYRNIFGDAGDDEFYAPPSTAPASRKQHRKSLRWLVKVMANKIDNDDKVRNARIPAGYTYLAQILIHDSVQTLAPLPSLESDNAWRRNNRASRLVLDTIYGGGPQADPLIYAIDRKPRNERALLRLGRIKDPSAPDNTGPSRDLLRTGCPHLEDTRHLGGNPGDAAKARADVMIADPRNDDNLLISQMTVLFHLLHNALYEKITDGSNQRGGAPGAFWSFIRARRVVTLIYRTIVFKDLLSRLLHPDVYEAYDAKKTTKEFFDHDDRRMPLEFSHGVARIGHAMVRGRYRINKELKDNVDGKGHGVISFLTRTSTHLPTKFPLDKKWLVNWSFLFELGNPAPELPQSSRKISPSAIHEFSHLPHFGPVRDGVGRVGEADGLFYRDFIRGAESCLRSVSSILANLPRDISDQSPLVTNGKLDTAKIDAWILERQPLGDEQKADKHRQTIASNPPLLFFCLLEAALTGLPADAAEDEAEYGTCLGAVGSAIFAEFVFKERLETQNIFEKNEDLLELRDELLEGKKMETMPDLIRWISEQHGWDTPDDGFSS